MNYLKSTDMSAIFRTMELQEVPYKTQTANTHGDILEQAFDTKMEYETY